MSFFARYFAALDGPDPYSSLDMVADDLEFAIEWAPGPDRKSHQIRGGRAELRAFIDSGERGEWAHYLLHSATGDGAGGDEAAGNRTEFALGETRRPGGERVATFVAVAELGDDGRMRRYLVARSPAIAFNAVHVK
jgi:hypothetical protein